jgi:hypothetical protein
MNSIIKAIIIGLTSIIVMLNHPEPANAQFFRSVAFTNMIVQSSTNVTGPYTDTFTLPTVVLLYDFDTNNPGFTIYYHLKINVIAASPTPDTTVISITSELQESDSGVDGPYVDVFVSTRSATTVTNPTGNAFYRSKFALTDTNFIYVDQNTFGWVVPF